ncbi:MAG: hypothetical protein JNM51_07770, partial [Bacteroidia bacterium]|nr:hypothetical protein [Bacteroidia bacterium]
RDAQGNVMAVYQSIHPMLVFNPPSISLKEQHIYGSSRLGTNTSTIDPTVINSNGNYYKRILGNKNYELSNHLGNVVAVINDRKITVAENCSGLSFDGNDDYAKINHNANYNFGTGDFTIEARIKASSTQTDAYPAVMSNRNTSLGFGSGFVLYLLNGKLTMYMNGNNVVSTTADMRDNAWHHVAVKRASGTVTLYVDGSSVASTTSSGNINTSYPLWVGIEDFGPTTTAFKGNINEVRLWNVAKSQTDINNNKANYLFGNETGLVGYWKMNEGSGQEMYDYTSAANNSTRGGTTGTNAEDPAWANIDCLQSTVNTYFTAEVINATDYYSFGSPMPGRQLTSSAYRYGFNGKEKDDEGLGGGGSTYDYGFRIYNPNLGKFLSVDPLMRQFPHYSPYQFAGNSPIFFIDLDGEEETPHPKFKEFKFDFFDFFGFDKQSERKEYYETNNPKVKQELSETFNRNKQRWNAWCNTAIKTKEVVLTAADVVLPVELAHQLITGQNIDGSDATAGDIAINIAGVIPLGKVFKGAKVIIKHGDKFIDVTANVFKAFEKANPCGCFTANTKVLTKRGLISIDSLKIGDTVISFNDSLKTYNDKKILSTLKYVRDSIYTIYLPNEIIQTTPDHPFYTNEKWVLAKNIKKGDGLFTHSKAAITVDSIKLVVSITNVYNFIVEDDHTYFVSNSNILVHNGGPCDYLAKTIAAFTKSGNLIPKELRDHISRSISNPELRNAFDQMYRKTAKILSGSTADALRDEVRNGKHLGHLEKAQGWIKNLQGLINEGKLSGADSKIANELLKDLKDAVKTALQASSPINK